MKNKIKAFLETMWEDAIKPLFLYTLGFVLIIGIPLLIVNGIISLLDIFFHNQGSNILGVFIVIALVILFILFIVSNVINYFMETLIPAYKKRLKKLNENNKKP